MSVAGIASSLFSFAAHNVPNRAQQFRQEFQQLGQDLQSGNLSAAQADFATLQQQQVSPSTSASSSNSTSSSGSSSIAQQFNQLSTDLQSGNLSAAQQDYAGIQQSISQQAGQTHRHHHHHHSESGGSDMSQLFSQLGQALQGGNLSAAQQAYSTLQQDFQQLAQSKGSLTPAALPPSTSTGLSVSA